MKILMKGLNEELNVKRCLSNFHDEPWVDEVIVIDGGSNDYTVEELKEFSKTKVYVHPWLDWYHDMEISQSNIALSYIPYGDICFIVDFDERLTPELKDELAEINKTGMPGDVDKCDVPRRTFELMRYDDSPHAMLEDDGWPIVSHQIGQYPDPQCRLIRRIQGMHWRNSPHHILFGHRTEGRLQSDILHYEKDDYRSRLRIERKWARAQARRKELGLSADVFDGSVRPEVHKYTDPNVWK